MCMHSVRARIGIMTRDGALKFSNPHYVFNRTPPATVSAVANISRSVLILQVLLLRLLHHSRRLSKSRARTNGFCISRSSSLGAGARYARRDDLREEAAATEPVSIDSGG